jgi:hypothetical protein
MVEGSIIASALRGARATPSGGRDPDSRAGPDEAPHAPAKTFVPVRPNEI